MMDKIGEGLKKIVLAGIGATAITGEKAQEVLNQLVEKGELTVEQGKALNEELKHNAEEKKAKQQKAQQTKKEVNDLLNSMTDEQVSQLKDLLESIKGVEKEAAEETKEETPSENE